MFIDSGIVYPSGGKDLPETSLNPFALIVIKSILPLEPTTSWLGDPSGG